MGPRWEEMFRSHLRRLAASGNLGEQIVTIGPWWTDNAEIDAVALAGRSRAPVLAKWARTVRGAALLEGLRRSASALPGADIDKLRLARERVEVPPPGTLVVTASEVMSAD